MNIRLDNATLLIVDADDFGRTRLVSAFREVGLRVVGASSILEAHALIDCLPIHLAIVELRLPDGTGHDVIKLLRSAQPDSKCVVLTRYGNVSHAVAAIRAGAVDVVAKPITTEELLEIFDRSGDGPSLEHSIHPDLARLEHIAHVFNTDAEGNVSKAARMLNMHRRTLQRTLDKLRQDNDAA